MEATSRWYTVTKSHQSSPGPKRFTIQRTGSCELICQFIRQRNSHWATRALLIYICIFFFLSNPLISLSLFICASSCREVTYTFLILFHDSIVGDICSNDDDDDDDNPQEQATSIFESCDVRGELVIGVGARSWTRFARSPRFYRRSKSLEIEKDPFLGVTEKKEAAPLVRQSGKSRGLEPFRAKAVYVMSLGSWIRIRSARVQLFFTLGRNFVNHLLIEIIDLRTKGRIRLFYCSFRFK